VSVWSTQILRNDHALASLADDRPPYDFLRGTEPYNLWWRPVPVRNQRLLLGRTRILPRVYATAVQGRAVAADIVKERMPWLPQIRGQGRKNSPGTPDRMLNQQARRSTPEPESHSAAALVQPQEGPIARNRSTISSPGQQRTYETASAPRPGRSQAQSRHISWSGDRPILVAVAMPQADRRQRGRAEQWQN
jgi:hypothetical protein